MKKRFVFGALLTLFLGMEGCVKQFNFEAEKDHNYLVVFGELTNETMVHKINISRGADYTNHSQDGDNFPELGAEVYIEENGTKKKITSRIRRKMVFTA